MQKPDNWIVNVRLYDVVLFIHLFLNVSGKELELLEYQNGQD